MSPFLASSVHVVKKDGSTVDINSGGSPDDPDEVDAGDGSSTTAHVGTSSKHSKHSESHDTPFEVVPIVAIVFVFLWLIVKALMAPFTQRAAKRSQAQAGGSSAALSDEEQAVLLKLQRTITDMERRIESLETILIDEHRTKENYGSKI